MTPADDPKSNPTRGGGATGTAEKTTVFARMDGDNVDAQEYAALLDLYDNSFRNIAEGEVVKGTVLKVTPSEVIVDVGYKSEGIIPVDEFVDETGQITVQPGDIVDVLLERTEDREGYVVLSREKAEKMKIWDEVEKAYAEKKVVIGRVIERIKGGLAVDIGGIDGLLHITDMSWGRVSHPSELFKVNDEIDVIVLKYDPATERVSLGHKQLMNDPWSNVIDRYPVGARM